MLGRRSRISLSISGEATYKIIGFPLSHVDVIVREISKNGLKFVTSNAIEQGTLIELSIKLTSISEPIQAVAKVLWQRKLSSRFLLDTCVKFIEINDKNSNKLVRYIYEYAASSVISREYVRCSLITEVNFFDLNAENIKGKCLSADIGVKGMKLLVQDMLDVGRELMLNFNLLDGNPEPLNLNGKVAWARKGANNVLGVCFKKLSESDLNRIVRYVEAKLSQKS
ncbi:MAG: PilZ domain-containing protein [Candidatus Omnitrophica bacterium]|nr:PilZ domain-containing protein [Candidatus Omnitrophota bacterium]